MKQGADNFTVDDFIPLEVIEAAQFPRNIFGGYKQTTDWSYGGAIYKDVVFDTGFLDNPRKVLMTMLLYWEAGLSHFNDGAAGLILCAYHTFIRDCSSQHLGELLPYGAGPSKMLLLILKFYPVSEKIVRLIATLLPAFLGATNHPDAGSVFGRRPLVFNVSDTLRAQNMQVLVYRLNRYFADNGDYLKVLHDMLKEQRIRDQAAADERLEKEALKHFLTNFVGFNQEEWEQTKIELEAVLAPFPNMCSIKGLSDQIHTIYHAGYDPAIHSDNCCVPQHLFFKTVKALFETPIIIDGVCSSCWAIKQPGSALRTVCKLHKVIKVPVPSAPPVEDVPTPNSISDCPMCLGCKIQIVMVPCGHFVCSTCSARIKDCPLCRGAVNKFVKCYF